MNAGAEQQSEMPKYYEYTQVQSPEEGLYKALRDYVDGKLTRNDLIGMASMYCNSFPPFVFFYHRSGTEEYIRDQVNSAQSPAEFAQTELFRDIMADSTVVERFQLASPDVVGLTGENEYPPYWPQKYRLSLEERVAARRHQDTEIAQRDEANEAGWSAEVAPQAKGWRARVRDLLRWN